MDRNDCHHVSVQWVTIRVSILLRIKTNKKFTMFCFNFRPLLFSSLILIAIGNGSIRACITSLGGNQFQLPEQVNSLNNYFSHYYFMYYMGILLSKLVPPAIRAHTQCFGKDDCYMAVFGALGLVFLMCWCECKSIYLF